MNKKKVIELINKAQLTSAKVNGKDNKDTLNLTILEAVLQQVESELKKPDWISVEDELPPYGEEVLVCDKDFPDDIWFSLIANYQYTDGNGFPPIRNRHITHWRRIDKLEV